jgi:hypothetical protein
VDKKEMSKKILNVLDKSVPLLLEVRSNLLAMNKTNEQIKQELDKLVEEISKELHYCSMRELIKFQNNIQAGLLNLKTDLILSLGKQTFTPHLEELEAQQFEFEQKLDIINTAILNKQQYQQKFTHPVERNIIRHGLFSSSSPNEITLRQLRNDKGELEQVRKGFRKLYYKNEYGNLLTGYDTKVFVALLKLWEVKGKNQVIQFDFSELLRDGMEIDSYGGKDYALIAESLRNLAGTKIIMEEYLDPISGKIGETLIHSPIVNARITHKHGIARASMQLNNLLHDSLMAGNYILINMSLFNDLATGTSRNLYLYIVNELPEDQLVIDIDPLIEHLQLQSSTKAKAVNLIKEAFQELMDFKVIKSYNLIKEGKYNRWFTFEPSDWLNKQNILPRLEQATGLNIMS